MKFYTMLILLIGTAFSAYADGFTIGIGNTSSDFLTQQTLRNQAAERDRRTEASAAVLLGIINAETPTYQSLTDFETHDLDHGLGEGMIINDPAYYKPAEKTTIDPKK